MNLRSYLFDNQFKITVVNNKVNVVNYQEIDSFDDEKIIVRHKDGIAIIVGNNLTITKLLDEELLINGDILKLEFR